MKGQSIVVVVIIAVCDVYHVFLRSIVIGAGTLQYSVRNTCVEGDSEKSPTPKLE